MSFNVLVVEDNTDTRELLYKYFTTAGFNVQMAADGGEGLHLVRTNPPDIIITDIAMPQVTGTEMIEQLRSDPETAKIPILVFTARGSSTTKEALAAGATKAFYKPFDFNSMIDIVRELIATSPKSQNDTQSDRASLG
jgi:DNA-binding response OmpR family regulator